VVIEMPGALGSATEYGGRFAGLAERIGRQLTTKAELQAALRRHLDEWQRDVGRKIEVYQDTYVALLPALLLRMSALMADDATFYVCRAFEAGPRGQVLRPDWSLGLVVESGVHDA
jgi:hypothetical protein